MLIFFLLDGIKCFGNSLGTSKFLNLMLIRYSASANSSESSIPSLSISAISQILFNTFDGRFDFIIWALALDAVMKKSIGFLGFSH